jgi:general secretion pathway protein A
MDYFRILNLEREPFSNSPEPDFFFESIQHRQCLQQLELAIRLRRGLNIVIGDVGTGKTTLCRQLILRLEGAGEATRETETHLMMDPSFGSPLEFLENVAAMFGLPAQEHNTSEWALKEAVKNYLFHRGVDEKRIVVLIIDEGQKLPHFCLEILREFLNFETNEYKLLQIVLFAQKEFQDIMKDRANFSDRINLYYSLQPLGLRQMSKMIAFRIAKASGNQSPPRFFTSPGILAVYLATNGYPRKVITLCHQLMLSLIIQNRARAGWFMVRSCSQRLQPDKPVRIQWGTTTLLGVLVLMLLLLVAGYSFGLFEDKVSLQGDQRISLPVKESVPAVKSSPGSIPKAIAAVAGPPEILGQVTVGRGETVSGLLSRIYGPYNSSQLGAFLKANPHVSDMNRIRAGDAFTLPAVTRGYNPLPEGRYWICLKNERSLQDTYRFLKNNPKHLPPLRLFPYWNPGEGLVFCLLLKEGYSLETAASAAIRQFPADLAGKAIVIGSWDEKTEFYAR